MTRSERVIAEGPSPYTHVNETMNACLARHGYTTEYVAPGKFRVIRNGRVRLLSRHVWQTTAWLIRRNRKLAALRGAL